MIYTSFFTGLGKVSFLTTFFQLATFITSGSDPPGSIGILQDISHTPSHDDDDGDDDDARYSFLRLVGCAYYKQHASAFRLPTPAALFHSVTGSTSTYHHHHTWLANIRNCVRQRVEIESKTMPSTESLLLHWKRCTWVIAMWHCATQSTINLPRKYIQLSAQLQHAHVYTHVHV